MGVGLDLMGGNDGGLRDFDAAGYARFTEGMVKIGLPEKTIRGVLGENWLAWDDPNATAPPA